jgi:Family of unknown function (DUF6869)
MTWCDERLGLDPAADEMTQERLAQAEAKLAALSLADLVRGWREVGTVGLRARTSGCHCFSMYFDRVGHDDPERALAFIEGVVTQEPNDGQVALLAQEKLLSQLLHFNAARVVDGLEAAAGRLPRLRWLLGAFAWGFRGGMLEDKDIARRLAAVADEAAYKAWEDDYKAGRERIDFAALSPTELAQHWVELTAYSPLERERDDNAMALFDYQWELAKDDPQRALALVIEIVQIEQHPRMLGLLAAGLVEDLLVAHGPDVIDAIEVEARGNPRFRQMLSGVWTSRVDPAVAERLAAAIGMAAT